MGGDSKKKKTKKKRVLAENGVGADDAPDALKKPRTTKSSAVAETTVLSDEAIRAARKFQTQANEHASGWEPQQGENAAELVERVAEATDSGINLIAKSVVRELDPKNQPPKKKWNSTTVRNALKRALSNVSAAAFVAAGAPPEKKEEEGYVAGNIDVRRVTGKGPWFRFDSATKGGLDNENLEGVTQLQISATLRGTPWKGFPVDKYAKERWGIEVRHVTDAVRCATAENKVVRGFHAKDKVRRKTSARERLATAVAVDEEEEEAKAALAATAKKEKEAVRKARYESFGLTYFEAPPLPDGATDADRERLLREDLKALYKR
jgi:hypothetical protein